MCKTCIILRKPSVSALYTVKYIYSLHFSQCTNPISYAAFFPLTGHGHTHISWYHAHTRSALNPLCAGSLSLSTYRVLVNLLTETDAILSFIPPMTSALAPLFGEWLLLSCHYGLWFANAAPQQLRSFCVYFCCSSISMTFRRTWQILRQWWMHSILHTHTHTHQTCMSMSMCVCAG